MSEEGTLQYSAGGAADGPAPRAARLAVAGAVTLLALMWAGVYVVDVFGLVAPGTLLEGRVDPPFLWVLLFRENGLAENVQWLLLGLATVAAGGTAAATRGRERVVWTLLAVTLMVMLMEDLADIRHAIADLVAGDIADGDRTVARTLAEVGFLGAAGSVPALGVLLGWRSLRADPAGWRRLVAGGSVYAVAAAASVTRDVGNWYERVGTTLERTLFLDRMVPFDADGAGSGFWLMDFMVEESLEMVGAALLLAAMLTYRAHRGTTAPTRSRATMTADEP